MVLKNKQKILYNRWFVLDEMYKTHSKIHSGQNARQHGRFHNLEDSVEFGALVSKEVLREIRFTRLGQNSRVYN